MSLHPSLIDLARFAPEATLLLSREGTILYANPCARDVLAMSEDHSASSIASFAVDSPELLAGYLKMWARSVEPLPGTLNVRRRSSEAPIRYRCRGARLLGAAESIVIVCRLDSAEESSSPFVLLNQTIAELTEEVRRRGTAEEALRKSEASLQERVMEAETANQSKDEFLAALSHELRTPLNAILGWTILLRQGLDKERQARAIETIERNARAQVKLIEELLDVSRIVSGKLRLNVQQIDPIRVAESALETLRPAADARGVRMHAVLDPLAGPISSDPDRLEQVFWNILSNAIKFTPRGGRVEVLLERAGSSIEFTVTDTGQGISSAFLPHVFERFRQGDGGTARKYGGLGLGLSIAKSIVELHGGTIRVQSQGEGKGATFIVQLPRAVVVRRSSTDPQSHGRADSPQRSWETLCPPEIDGLRVVLVDDEIDATQVMTVLLDLCGAKVRSARTAEEAFELVKHVLPDILISDIGMPGEDGYQLIKKIRALLPSQGGRTYAIALTAHARTEDRTRALQAGFHAHVPKPVEPSELLAVISSLVRR